VRRSNEFSFDLNKYLNVSLGKISISINGVFFIPKNSDSDDDIKTAERANQFEVFIFVFPIKYLF